MYTYMNITKVLYFYCWLCTILIKLQVKRIQNLKIPTFNLQTDKRPTTEDILVAQTCKGKLLYSHIKLVLGAHYSFIITTGYKIILFYICIYTSSQHPVCLSRSWKLMTADKYTYKSCTFEEGEFWTFDNFAVRCIGSSLEEFISQFFPP
jgi:hypothetical protein